MKEKQSVEKQSEEKQSEEKQSEEKQSEEKQSEEKQSEENEIKIKQKTEAEKHEIEYRETEETVAEIEKRPPGRRPLSEGSADDTRRMIQHHAVRLFNERGYTAVSLDDIAEAAGLTRATLYYHYRGKSEIFVQSVKRTLDRVLEEIETVIALRQLSVRTRLQLLVDGRRETEPEEGVADDMASEAMVQEAFIHLGNDQRASLQSAFGQMHELVAGLIQEGIQSGEFRDLPLEIVQYVFWQLFQPQIYPTSLERKHLEHGWLDILLNGIVRK